MRPGRGMGEPMRSFHSPAQINRWALSPSGKEPIFCPEARRRAEQRANSGAEGKAQGGAVGPGWVFPQSEELEPRREQAQRDREAPPAQGGRPPAAYFLSRKRK